MEARRGGWHRARVTLSEAHVLRPWSEEPPLHPLVPIYAWERLPGVRLGADAMCRGSVYWYGRGHTTRTEQIRPGAQPAGRAASGLTLDFFFYGGLALTGFGAGLLGALLGLGGGVFVGVGFGAATE